MDNSSQIKSYLLVNLSENAPLFQAGHGHLASGFSKNWNPSYHKATESRVPLRALPPFLSANSKPQTWNNLNSESPPKTYQDWLRYYQLKLKNSRGRDKHRVLAWWNLMIWWILLHQSCRFFSLQRGRKNWGFTVPFYSVRDCSLWNRRFFFVFFRRAEESAKRGWRASCARLALHAWPALAFAHLKNAPKKNNNNNNACSETGEN